jgi:competence protein ComEC
MEDCEQASLVITTRQAQPDCRALVIDRRTLRDSGAMTLQRADKAWKIERAVPAGAERPWAHTQHPARASFMSATPSPTPRADDLQSGD